MDDGVERRGKPARRRGVERSVEVQLGPLGGFDLRPTRLFVWGGQEREGRERIVSLGAPPKTLFLPRRERKLHAGAVRVRALGNPLLTVALAGAHVARRIAREREALERASGSESAGRGSAHSRRPPDSA